MDMDEYRGMSSTPSNFFLNGKLPNPGGAVLGMAYTPLSKFEMKSSLTTEDSMLPMMKDWVLVGRSDALKSPLAFKVWYALNSFLMLGPA